MIRIRQDRTHPPAILTDATGRAARERADAERYYADPLRPKRAYKFEVYKDDAVKNALEKLFHGKCAYCESRYAATQPMDVEHWRPKGNVDAEAWESGTFAGYHWLASEWDNLLPSCIDCNRSRTQTVGPDRTVRPVGKGMRFPLAQGSSRATCRAEMADEQPLLLHPCADDPADHLRLSDEEPSFIIGRTERGQTSVDVYGLNRSGLVISRADRLFEVRHVLYEFRELTLVRNNLRTTVEPKELAARDIVEELIKRVLHALERMRRDDQPYAMMSRALIDAYMEDLLGDDPG